VIGGQRVSGRYYDNHVKFNLLYKNTTCSGGSAQTSISDPSAVILTGNAIVTAPPGFIDEAESDLELAAGSPMIDGVMVPVTDASYFFDGFGIPGETGDVIQLEGQGVTAVVLAVNYSTNTLTLDRPLTWTAGQGVSLSYRGASPDVGAFEFDGADEPPMAPTNLRIIGN
jgi:hypothetical protein